MIGARYDALAAALRRRWRSAAGDPTPRVELEAYVQALDDMGEDVVASWIGRRGQVRSITFVFNDGTIRTIPEDREGNQQNNQQRDGLGWISDPHGIPCVSGERRSNAQQYLGSQALITAAGAGVASLIESDSGRMSYVGSDGSIGTVGISGQEAVGQILAGGVRDMSAWVNKLYGQAFAAVYVQPGAKVAVHLEKPLAIDFDPEGRKVDHRTGESHALELE